MVMALYTIHSADDHCFNDLPPSCAARGVPGISPGIGCRQRSPTTPREVHKALNTRDILTDFSETKELYEVRADLPGVSKEDITIDIEELNLTIGTKAKEAPAADGGVKMHRLERAQQYRRRAFRLPEDADTSNVAARCENGVLVITIGKKQLQAAEGPRRVAIA